LENIEKLSVRGEGRFKTGWSRDAMKLFKVLSLHWERSSGIVEAFMALPTCTLAVLGLVPRVPYYPT